MGTKSERQAHKDKRLSLYPMKFEEALKALLKVPPPPKEEHRSPEKNGTRPPQK